MVRRALLPSLLLAALVLAAFSGVADNGFVPYDDGTYVTENPAVRAGLSAAGLRWAFTSLGYASNWHPLTWVSHMADVQLFGLDPRRHHEVNLLLHLAGCLLLFRFVRSATGRTWRSFFAAGLFAVHPLRVESVAWLAERKDVLAFVFGMLTLVAWLAWLRRPASRWRLVPVAAAFLAGLLSKPTLVVLPAAMLLAAWWPLGSGVAADPRAPRRPATRAAAGAAWLLAPAAVVALLSWLAQRAGGGLLEQAAPAPALRLANALTSVVAYLGKTVLPRELAVFYPLPPTVGTGAVVAAAALLLGISWAAWRARRSRPQLLIGWLWFLLTLLPALGLVPVGAQAMADRYTYFPAVGLSVAAVWLAGDLVAGRPIARLAAAAAGCVLLLALVPVTRAQVATWRDGQALFSQALAATRDNWHIEHEYGVLEVNRRRYPEAEARFRAALRIQPDHVLARYNLGGLLFREGRAAEAAAEYREAVRLRPDFAEAHFRLGRALGLSGDSRGALAEYDATLRLEPGHAAAAAARRKTLSEPGRRDATSVPPP